MGPIGMPELLVILIIALIIFGPRKLPELGRSLGKSIAEFKRASNELKNTLEEEIRIDEAKTAATARAAAAPTVPTAGSPAAPPPDVAAPAPAAAQIPGPIPNQGPTSGQVN